jgi:pimeloyl-ACP methyl ester carboxylesterase
MFSHRKVLAMASAVASLFLVAASPARTFNPAPYLHPQQLVDVGGRKINLYCSGTGSPAVILDTDIDDPSLAWRFVQPAVARHTRVCSYDAAGLGFSDPARGQRDAAAVAADLHALVQRAHIPAPYVLVGFGFSGLPDRLYADRYLRDLAGMVLVDPLVPYRNKHLARMVPQLSAGLDDSGFIAGLQMCRNAAAKHELTAGTKAFNECMWPTGPTDPSLPAALRAVLQRQWQRTGAWDDFLANAKADDRSSQEVIRAQHGYGNLPLVVLTSDVHVDMQGMGLSRAQFANVARAYVQWQQHVAALSSHGTDIVLNGVGESPPTQDPASVISAIDRIVDRARTVK